MGGPAPLSLLALAVSSSMTNIGNMTNATDTVRKMLELRLKSMGEAQRSDATAAGRGGDGLDPDAERARGDAALAAQPRVYERDADDPGEARRARGQGAADGRGRAAGDRDERSDHSRARGGAPRGC